MDKSGLEKLKKEVFEANLLLVKYGLVIFTWGNVSAIDRKEGIIVIKPSGVDYDVMTADDMVVTDLDGNPAAGGKRPSSDTPTHAELYKRFTNIGAVVHTHSRYATSWAQARRDLAFYGTTHADHFYGPVPCTRPLTEKEVGNNYELNTGRVIAERFNGINPDEVPSVLVAGHGPFSWGKDALDAVHNAVVLEEVAGMALNTEIINRGISPAEQYLLDKHYLRKHGKNAYYGQNNKK